MRISQNPTGSELAAKESKIPGICVPQGVPVRELNYETIWHKGPPLELNVTIDEFRNMSCVVNPKSQKHLEKFAIVLPRGPIHYRFQPETNDFLLMFGSRPKLNNLEVACVCIADTYRLAKIPKPERITLKFPQPIFLNQHLKLDVCREPAMEIS